MRFICNHGYLYAECQMCTGLDELIEDAEFQAQLDETQYEEYYWLDRDERELRKSEEQFGI